MKNFFYLTVTLCLFLLNESCSKTDDTNGNMPTIMPDSLGVGWRKVVLPNSIELYDIFFNSGNNNGYVTGKNVFKSTNGGNDWTLVTTDSTFFNLFITNDNKGFFINQESGLWQNSNASSNFSLTIPTAINTRANYDIHFPDNNHGFYIGNGELFTTSNGGNNWSKQITNITLPTNSFSYSSLYFIDSLTGWIISRNKIYSTNNASTFQVATVNYTPVFQGLVSVFAISRNIVYVTTFSGEILKSIDGGLTFNFLVKFLPETTALTDIHFFDAQNGYASFNQSIYKTTDGGTTWKRVVRLGNAVIYEIHFTDINHGWACGTNGTVLIFKQ
jgi:photosystem II stability/assembly factor-like uncharacterized protein